MSTPVTKQYIIDRFNQIVMNGLANPPRSGASWHNSSGGAVDNASTINRSDLGPQAENYQTTFPPNELAATTVFNIVHAWAMELTRVRKGKLVLSTDSPGSPTISSDSVALRRELSLYFPIPGGQREPGSFISSPDLDSFLGQLRDQVNSIRNSNTYMHTFVSCHSSCHSACHGSRGRR